MQQIMAVPDSTGSNHRIQGSDVPLDADAAQLPGHITVTHCASSTAQAITDAAAYIVHLPPRSRPEDDYGSIRSLLQVYLGVLRVSGGVLLIPTIRLLSEPGGLSNLDAEAVARTRDLSMLQLANNGEMALAELLQIIGTVSDSVGKLVVANELKSTSGAVLVLITKHINH
jgi:hypothetical protein